MSVKYGRSVCFGGAMVATAALALLFASPASSDEGGGGEPDGDRPCEELVFTDHMSLGEFGSLGACFSSARFARVHRATTATVEEAAQNTLLVVGQMTLDDETTRIFPQFVQQGEVIRRGIVFNDGAEDAIIKVGETEFVIPPTEMLVVGGIVDYHPGQGDRVFRKHRFLHGLSPHEGRKSRRQTGRSAIGAPLQWLRPENAIALSPGAAEL